MGFSVLTETAFEPPYNNGTDARAKAEEGVMCCAEPRDSGVQPFGRCRECVSGGLFSPCHVVSCSWKRQWPLESRLELRRKPETA
jgi:hypothetical protein